MPLRDLGSSAWRIPNGGDPSNLHNFLEMVKDQTTRLSSLLNLACQLGVSPHPAVGNLWAVILDGLDATILKARIDSGTIPNQSAQHLAVMMREPKNSEAFAAVRETAKHVRTAMTETGAATIDQVMDRLRQVAPDMDVDVEQGLDAAS
jgi:hypothetical protein